MSHTRPLSPMICVAAVLMLPAASGSDLVTHSEFFEAADVSIAAEGRFSVVAVVDCDPVSLCSPMAAPGKPDLPVRLISLLIPQGHIMRSLRATPVHTVQLPGVHTVLPQRTR